MDIRVEAFLYTVKVAVFGLFIGLAIALSSKYFGALTVMKVGMIGFMIYVLYNVYQIQLIDLRSKR